VTERILLQVADLGVGDITPDIHENPEFVYQGMVPEIELACVVEVGLDSGPD
jgi:hypothetical protein